MTKWHECIHPSGFLPHRDQEAVAQSNEDTSISNQFSTSVTDQQHQTIQRAWKHSLLWTGGHNRPQPSSRPNNCALISPKLFWTLAEDWINLAILFFITTGKHLKYFSTFMCSSIHCWVSSLRMSLVHTKSRLIVNRTISGFWSHFDFCSRVNKGSGVS